MKIQTLGILMANELLREKLLNYLANSYETKGPTPASITEFCQQYSYPFEQVRPVIGMLHVQGIIRTVTGEEHALLTPSGYEIAKPSDPCVRQTGGTHINFNAPVTGAAIAIDQASASVSNITGNDARVNQNSSDNSANLVQINTPAIQHIEALRTELDQINLSEDVKADARDALDTIEEQIKTGNPKKSVVSALLKTLPCIESITTIAGNILGSLS